MSTICTLLKPCSFSLRMSFTFSFFSRNLFGLLPRGSSVGTTMKLFGCFCFITFTHSAIPSAISSALLCGELFVPLKNNKKVSSCGFTSLVYLPMKHDNFRLHVFKFTVLQSPKNVFGSITSDAKVEKMHLFKAPVDFGELQALKNIIADK